MEYIFWFSILFIIYTFLGYPLILFILVKNKCKQPLPLYKYNEAISVVMVVCNENKYIKEKINNIFEMEYPSNLINLVIVDDASDDDTVAIIEGIQDPRITLLKQLERKGKAEGLNAAFKYVKTELTLLLDARQRVTLNALSDLSAWFEDKNVAAVSGEVKFIESCDSKGGMDAYQKYERFIRKSEASIASVPGVSGAIYMLRTSKFEAMPVDTILDDVLIPMVASKHGQWIGFDERVIAWDIPSNDWNRERKRKTRTLNGNYQLLFRNLSWCTSFGHYNWKAFVSHKVTRLLAPLFMLLVLISAVDLGLSGNDFYMLSFIVMVLAILLYPVSIVLPVLNRFKIIRIFSAFIALNWFNVLGFISFISINKKQSWK